MIAFKSPIRSYIHFSCQFAKNLLKLLLMGKERGALPPGGQEPGSPAFLLCRTRRDRPAGPASSPTKARGLGAVFHLCHPRTSDWSRPSSCHHPLPHNSSPRPHRSDHLCLLLEAVLTDLLASISGSICVFQEQPVQGPRTSWENGYFPCSHLESAWTRPWKSIAGLCPDNAGGGHAPAPLGCLGGHACSNQHFSFWK